MKEQVKLNLSRIWLLTGIVTLILPVFLPSSANPQNILQNVIGTSTVTMFILSFPSSLFGIPILFFAQIALGVDPNTIAGMYLNLFLMFILGSVQWFWIVPRIWRQKPELSIFGPDTQSTGPLLSETTSCDSHRFFEDSSRTPLERAINDDETDEKTIPASPGPTPCR